MIHKIKKKLIHFYTNGNIAEDFVASRRVKVGRLRGLIRACFYLHCVAALLCIGLSVALGIGSAVIYITVCTLISAWFALFAVGDLMVMKIISPILDWIFAAAAIVTGAFIEPKIPYFICGGIMILAGIAAIGALITGIVKGFLEEYSPRLIRREDYTLLSEVGVEGTVLREEEIEKIPPLPPLTSDMRELSKQLREILCAKPKNDTQIIDEITEKKASETE